MSVVKTLSRAYAAFEKAKAGIAAENKAFNRMSAKKQRIAIVKDALGLIAAGSITPQQGTYVRDLGYVVEGQDAAECQVTLLTDIPHCQCCALGSLLVCGIRNKDSIDGNKLREIGSDEIKSFLHGVFSEDQLSLIEAAFECDSDFADPGVGTFNVQTDAYEHPAKVEAAVVFGERYTNDTKRLVAILKNILKNDGVFKP